jgi:hypothetical protein
MQSTIGKFHHISQIIWFNNEFHASGDECGDGKVIFLRSKDGKDWSIVSDQYTQEITATSINAMIGSGADNPTLVAIGTNGQVYYQKLNLNEGWHASDLLLNNANTKSQLISYHHKFLLITTTFPANMDDTSIPQIDFYLSADGKNWKSIATPAGVLVGFLGTVFSVDEDKLLVEARKEKEFIIAELGIDETNNVLTIQNMASIPKSPKMSDLDLDNAIYSPVTKAYYFIFADHDNNNYYWTRVNTLQDVATANLQILNIENNSPYELSTNYDGINHYLFMFKDKPYFLADVRADLNSRYYEDTAIYNLVNS